MAPLAVAEESKYKSAKAAESASAQTAKAAQDMAKAAKRVWLARLLRWREAALGWRPGVNTTDVHAMLCCAHIDNPKLLELDFT